MNIDRKDERILAELLTNSRESRTQIGKSVGLSRESVHYRIKQLNDQVIRNHLALIDARALGYAHYVCFLNLKNVTPAQEQTFLDCLHDHPNISWTGTLAGRWGLTFDLYAPNETEVDAILKKFFEEYVDWVGEYQVLTVRDSAYYFEKLLGVDNPPRILHQADHDIDKVDLQILRRLNDDAQSTYAHLSKEIGLTANAIRYRIKNLEDAGIIVGYTISIDQGALGYQWYGVQVQIMNSQRLKALGAFFSQHENVTFTYQYTSRGLHDFDIGIAVRDPQELKNFIDELRQRYGNDMRITDTFMVLDEHSGHNLPQAVFDQTEI